MPRQSPDDRYRYYMNLVKQDPMAAGQQFLAELERSPKKTRGTIGTINQLKQILAGDESAWQYGSKSIEDALSFIISNSLLSAMGMTVVKPSGVQREDLANTIANMISEDVDFLPLTIEQRRMKMLAESYGFVVYQLPTDSTDSAEEVA